VSDQRAVLPMAGDAQSLEAEVQQQLAEQRQALEDVRSALEAAGSAHSAESAELLVARPKPSEAQALCRRRLHISAW